MGRPPLVRAAGRLAARSARRGAVPALLLVLDSRLSDPLAAVAALPAGAAVLLRHPTAEGLAALGRRVAPLCRRRHLCLLVAADWRLADRLGADGLHLPEALARGGGGAPLQGWRRRRRALLTVAAHAPAALATARRLGADAAILSPLFPTASHPGRPAIGVSRFRLWARRAGVPVVALGGVGPATARGAETAGAVGLAAVHALAAAP
jgi:thiamine-phosphate pyrophosphorylase